jgi:uncharacterized membrane-anchored protein YhcB (DUF1043 family)
MQELEIKKEAEESNEELKQLKQDLRDSYGYFLNCSNKLLEAEKEIDQLKQREKDIKELAKNKNELNTETWRDVSRKLYSCVLHLNSISNFSNIAILGPGLRSEVAESLSKYEKLIELETAQ